eukprot:359135-Chlamydomonas_euryale.AAC.1
MDTIRTNSQGLVPSNRHQTCAPPPPQNQASLGTCRPKVAHRARTLGMSSGMECCDPCLGMLGLRFDTHGRAQV